MNPFTDPAQKVLAHAAHLGALAARNTGRSAPVPDRLATILRSFQQRERIREEMQSKLRADEFTRD